MTTTTSTTTKTTILSLKCINTTATTTKSLLVILSSLILFVMQDYYSLNLNNHNRHHHGPFVMGQLQNGRRIECVRFQPVDMTKILGPLPESVKRCYGCTCPDGFVDCKRVNEAVECQLTPKPSLKVPQSHFHKAPMQQPHSKPSTVSVESNLSVVKQSASPGVAKHQYSNPSLPHVANNKSPHAKPSSSSSKYAPTGDRKTPAAFPVVVTVPKPSTPAIVGQPQHTHQPVGGGSRTIRHNGKSTTSLLDDSRSDDADSDEDDQETSTAIEQLGVPPLVSANTAKISETMGINLEDKYKKYSALGIRFTTRTAPTTTTMLPPTTITSTTTTSTTTTTTTTTTIAPNINEPDYEDGPPNSNGSSEVTDAENTDHIDDDEYSSSTPAPAASTTITISSTTTTNTAEPTLPHGTDKIVTKPPDLLFNEKTWDDVSDGTANSNGNSNSVIVAEQFISKPALFGDEMRARNQHYRSYMSSQENNWRSINGETMARIGIIVYIILLVIVLLAMGIICIATKIKYCSSSIEKQKQHQQDPPSLKLEPLERGMCNWYLGQSCDGTLAETLLSCFPSGTFLVRTSRTHQDSHVLSVVANSVVRHCLIVKVEDKYCFNPPYPERQLYPSLCSLVMDYWHQSLHVHDPELKTNLIYPLLSQLKKTSKK